MDNMNIKISKKAAITNAGYTYAQLAEKLGITKATLVKWVNNPITKPVNFMGFCYACNINTENVIN